jgi:glyoxylase-like metal-dependent hydrolase (beta-lactamase superfamily II)
MGEAHGKKQNLEARASSWRGVCRKPRCVHSRAMECAPRGTSSVPAAALGYGAVMNRLLTLFSLLCATAIAAANEVRFAPVAPGVYAHIGELGPRSVGNEGLNANLGLIVTPAGAILIDSGATWLGARRIEAAVRAVSEQPVRWVINTGTQDHRWFGNGYFASRGAVTIGHAGGRADMLSRGGDQLAVLQALLGDRASSTVPAVPTRWVEGPDQDIELGGARLRLIHRGGGHTPGDMMVWHPASGVLFAGDIVYVDRLLAILPVSNTRQWLAAFDAAAALQPRRVVPGHGRVTDMATAGQHTRQYLAAVRSHMKAAVERGDDIGAAVRSFDSTPYLRLQMAAELLPGNANRNYLELERE